MRLRIIPLFMLCLLCLSGRGVAAVMLDGTDNVSEISMLEEASRVLAKADHSYAGHRNKAMKSLEKACDILGRDISGNGAGKERQNVSDNELRAAQRIIENVRDVAVEKNQHEVVKHLDNAINEINEALKTK